MEKVRVSEVNDVLSPASVKRCVGDALGTDGVAINYYELAPGESFSNTLHAHFDQEEVFYILEGTATFETDQGTVKVNAGSAIRFEPGEYQHGHNTIEEHVVGLVIAAPKESQQGSMQCPTCEARESPDVDRTMNAIIFRCAECGGEINRMT